MCAESRRQELREEPAKIYSQVTSENLADVLNLDEATAHISRDFRAGLDLLVSGQTDRILLFNQKDLFGDPFCDVDSLVRILLKWKK